MAALYIFSFLGIALLLMCNNCSCLPQGRSKRQWVAGAHPYLALVECSAGACSGSIISNSTVLSFCSCDETETTVYAGLLTAEEKETTAQKRKVKSVAKHSKMENLKIYSLDKDWESNEKVAAISLHLNKASRSGPAECTVVGFRTATGASAFATTMATAESCKLPATDGVFYTTATADTDLLTGEDQGGPAVSSGELWGVNEKPHTTGEAALGERRQSRDQVFCNSHIDIAHYSDWFREQTASGADSINRHPKKIPVIQVLVCPLLVMTVQFLILS